VTDDRLLSRREAMRICGMGLLATPLATLASCRSGGEKSFIEPSVRSTTEPMNNFSMRFSAPRLISLG